MKNLRKMLGYSTALAVIALAAVSCQSAGTKGAQARDIPIQVTDKGFEPAETKVAKGENVTLVFTRQTDQTCARDVVVKDRGTTVALPLNQPVRVALGTVNGKVSFACGMDMLTGEIVVE
jgi:plastocyanin domain-containing protein